MYGNLRRKRGEKSKMRLKKNISATLCAAIILLFSSVASAQTVLINGKGIGITLNSRGATVTDFCDISGESPAKRGGIQKGDIITKLNDTQINCVDDLKKALEKSKGAVMLEIQRNDSKITLKVKPQPSENGNPCLGIRAKDAVAGIGTLTFYDPETKSFGALGHGITDSTSGSLIKIDGGEVLSSTIISVKKGQKGSPGELVGIFGENDEPIGEIEKNTICGIFGEITLSEDEILEAQSIKTGTKADVRIGKAYIMANINGTKSEKFEIEICKIPVFSGDKTKGMVIKITDDSLLSKTGGIVRGMSGSPIVQNGRLVGAVTHVFVSDPTMGYGIFIEDMLAEAKN